VVGMEGFRSGGENTWGIDVEQEQVSFSTMEILLNEFIPLLGNFFNRAALLGELHLLPCRRETHWTSGRNHC